MKANEAPEKIFLDEDESWHLTNPNGDSVEYIRTDAFIEKATKYLRDKCQRFILTELDIENFEIAMKL